MVRSLTPRARVPNRARRFSSNLSVVALFPLFCAHPVSSSSLTFVSFLESLYITVLYDLELVWL